MTAPGTVGPARTTTRLAAAHGALLGAGAGLLAGLADVASTVLWLAPGADRLRLLVTLVALGAGLGAAVGIVLAVGHAALGRVVRAPWIRHAVVLAVPLVAVAHWLFAGGRMRRLPAQGVLQPVAAAALVALGATLSLRGTALVTAARTRDRRTRALAAGVATVLALALHAADHRVLPRLYEYLHAGLGALTALAFAVALALVVPVPRGVVRAGALVGVGALVAGALGWRALDGWVNVRAEVFGPHAPFVRHGVLALASVTGAREGRAPDPMALRRARYARERADAAGDPGPLPVFPGAHVLLITVDALRADRLGRVVDGRPLTPALDALAARGVVFQRAYAQAPHSSYSLSSMHTSEYLHETIPLGQPQPRTTLAEVLHGAGYHTAALYTRGIFFTEGDRLTVYRDGDYGFVRSVHVDRDAADQSTAAVAEIDDLVRRGEPPAMLWVHFFDAHAPYQGRGETPVARYDDAVRAVDAAVGTLLDHARRVLARDLVVAVTADHGEEFGEHGGVYHGSTLYDEQVRVPLVIAAPGLAPRQVSAPVELVDLAPTLAALVRVAPAPSMRGRDLRPAMVSDRPVHAVFSGVNTRKMVVRWPYKLVADLTYGVDELYDLAEDPHERRNLAGARPGLCADLRAEISVWLEALARSAPGQGALAHGRMGDRSASPALARLARDRSAPAADRAEAVDLLAGFADPALIPTLRPLLADPDSVVSASAAVALGSAGDPSARSRLADLVTGDPPRLRRAAARALARLGDLRAVPGLIETLWSADEGEGLDALRALGRLGDPSALEAVLAVLPDDHVRYRAVLALGQLRDPRAFPVLAEIALRDATDDARANAVAALGALGDPRAVPLVAGTITRDRAERYAAEALGALGAVGRTIDGFDARHPGENPGGNPGFTVCGPHEDTLGWRYLGAQSCLSAGAVASVTFRVGASGPRLLVLRLRRADDGPPVPVALRMEGREVARTTASPRWEEPRIALGDVPAGMLRLTLEMLPAPGDAPTLRLDHVLALPLR